MIRSRTGWSSSSALFTPPRVSFPLLELFPCMVKPVPWLDLTEDERRVVGSTVEVVVMLVPAIVEVLAGLIIVWTAIRLRQGRVQRGSAVGVRTPSTMRSDAAFETANKAAAPLAGAGGVIMAVGGVLAAVMPRHLFGVFVFGGVGLFLLLILLGAAIGVKASRSVP